MTELERIWKYKQHIKKIEQKLALNLSPLALDILSYLESNPGSTISIICKHAYFSQVALSTLKRAILHLKHLDLIKVNRGRINAKGFIDTRFRCMEVAL